MVLPTQPVTLEVAQVEELARHFSSFRHDVNGCLSLIVAATELIRYNPDVVKRMAGTLVEQPQKIAGKLREFVGQCHRTLGLPGANEPFWYDALWKRVNGAATAAGSIEVGPDPARALHSELVQFNKELTQLGFLISGAQAVPPAADSITMLREQFTKAALKFDQFATRLEETLKLQDGAAKRLGSGTPSGPVTLSPEETALFHRRLGNLERDLHESLQPLFVLARLARTNPADLVTRASEFSKQPPAISGILQTFGSEFDRTFAIQRTG